MKLKDNKLSTTKVYFIEQLQDIYDVKECDTLFLMLVEHYLKLTRKDLIVNGDVHISESEMLLFLRAIKRLIANEPIQYIIGQTCFYDAVFYVDKNVLIPRPETEELVDWIIKDHINSTVGLSLLDIGAGSGCIPISIQKASKTINTVYAIDVSEEALVIAQKNALYNKVEINFSKQDILSSSPKQLPVFDIVVSNPPYVLDSEKDEILPHVLDNEPHLALFVKDNDPLLFYRKILEFNVDHLKEGGNVYFEINQQFGAETISLLQDFNYKEIIVKTDLNGKDRMVKAIK